MFESKSPNLLVLGASGGVARAFLVHFSKYKHVFGKLILLDPIDRVTNDPVLGELLKDYVFLAEKSDARSPEGSDRLKQIISEHEVNVIVDISSDDTFAILELANEAGVSYINTSLNYDGHSLKETYDIFFERRGEFNKAPHIVATGMNPGVVNIWAAHGIMHHGVPKEIVHIEYDTSVPEDEWKPCVTWSIKQFLIESVIEPSGIFIGDNKIRELLPNALVHSVDMQKFFEPIMKLNEYPWGMTILHDENISVGRKFNVPSKFIYSVNIPTMNYIKDLYLKKGKIEESDLTFADNQKIPLKGTDNIGVLLDYEDKAVYYFNSTSNNASYATNATYTQVIVGVYSALFTLLRENLDPGVYFSEDLISTTYADYVFHNMRVQKFVFKKEDGELKLESYDPQLKEKSSIDHAALLA